MKKKVKIHQVSFKTLTLHSPFPLCPTKIFDTICLSNLGLAVPY